LDLNLEDAFSAFYQWEGRRMYSQDAVEGPQAFIEKRQPIWRGC
jgi:enoyl-CoA hydratase/carnithine racemase